MNTLPLQTTWSSGIDWNGLNPEDRKRINQIGFSAWLQEITTKKPKQEVKQRKLHKLADEFFRLARENKDCVTYEQAAVLCPAYPGDPAAWARAAGATVQTEKKNKRYRVVKYV